MSDVMTAIWARVSTAEQETENQVAQLQEWAARRGLEVVQIYRIAESGWKGAQQKHLSQVYDDARQGKFGILLVWALDRLSREGVGPTLEIVNRLGQVGVEVWSLQETWLETSGELRDLLLRWLAGWHGMKATAEASAPRPD